MYMIKRFFDCQVPVNQCNFECDYCTVGQWRKVNGEHPTQYTPFNYSIEQMRKALSQDRLGGTCAFNLCGNGETLMHPQILDLTDALLDEGHFVSIVTNGTVSSAIDFLCGMEEEKRSRVFLKFSFHYIELLKKNYINRYFENVEKAHKAGISLTVELVASDSNVPYIEDIKKVCLEKIGVLCHLTDPRLNTAVDIRHLTDMAMDEHLKVWRQFDSALFDYRQATWGDNRKKYFCYGGVWSFNLALGSGKLKQCYRNSDIIQYIFEDASEPIHFCPRGYNCSFAHCFNSHVFDCLCGVIPEISSPYYIELRNRILPDGTEWIKAAYKEIYNRKVCENNEEYSEVEKIIADGLVKLNNGIEPAVEFEKAFLEAWDGLLKYRKLIFGDNYMANWLKKHIKAYEQVELNAADIIFVTDYANYVQLKLEIANEERTNAKIISIVDILKI